MMSHGRRQAFSLGGRRGRLPVPLRGDSPLAEAFPCGVPADREASAGPPRAGRRQGVPQGRRVAAYLERATYDYH